MRSRWLLSTMVAALPACPADPQPAPATEARAEPEPSPDPPPSPPAALASIAELGQKFDADAGKVRLVLLLEPA